MNPPKAVGLGPGGAAPPPYSSQPSTSSWWCCIVLVNVDIDDMRRTTEDRPTCEQGGQELQRDRFQH